jgi:hypothetical protein
MRAEYLRDLRAALGRQYERTLGDVIVAEFYAQPDHYLKAAAIGERLIARRYAQMAMQRRADRAARLLRA